MATKAQLKAEQEKMTKLEAFGSSSSPVKSDFEEDGTENYLVFQSMGRYFIKIVNTYCISEWKSKGLSDESVKSPTISDNIPFPWLNYIGNKVRVKFVGNCLKEDKITSTHGKMVNIYIFYEINFWNYRQSDNLIPGNCLFDAVKLVKKTLTLINTSILDMVLDLIWKERLDFLLLDLLGVL